MNLSALGRLITLSVYAMSLVGLTAASSVQEQTTFKVARIKGATMVTWSEKATTLVSRHFVVKVSDSGDAVVLEELTSNERKREHLFATVLVRVTPAGSHLAGYLVNQTRPLGLGKCVVPPGLMKVFEGGSVKPQTLKHLDALFNNGGPFAAGRELWRRQQGGNRLKDPLPGRGRSGVKAGSNPSGILKGDGRDAQGRGRAGGREERTRPIDPWIRSGPDGERPSEIRVSGDRTNGSQSGSGYGESGVVREVVYGEDAPAALMTAFIRSSRGGQPASEEELTVAEGGVVRMETRTTHYENGWSATITYTVALDQDGNITAAHYSSELFKPQLPDEPKDSDSNPDEGGSQVDVFAEIARIRRDTGKNYAWMFIRPDARPGRNSSVLPPKEGSTRPIGDIARLGDNAIVNPDEGKSSSSGDTKMPLWPRGCPFDELFAPTNPR